MADRRDDYDDEPRGKSSRRSSGGGVSSVIPFKNGMALAAYYSGIFGLLSCFLFGVGGLFGIVPFVLGIMGFMKARSDPEARGSVHAWVGIILGLIEILTGCGTVAFFGITALSGAK